jgi:hypothetical protein
MVDTVGVPFVHSLGSPSSQSNNLFYSTRSTPAPSWATEQTENIFVNPLFTNNQDYDFTLQSSSPAISAGYNTTAIVPTSFFGETRVAGSVSIGATDLINQMPSPTIVNIMVQVP